MKKLYHFLLIFPLFFLALKAQSQSHTIYYENFDANDGGWVTSTAAGRNGNWAWTNNSFPLGFVGEGNYWRIQPFNVYTANALNYLTSPVINTTGFNNVSFAIDIRYKTSNDRDDGATIEYTFDPTGTVGWTPLGAVGSANSTNWYNDTEIAAIGVGVDGWSGENFTNVNSDSKFVQAVISDAAILDNKASIRFRVIFGSDGDTADLGVAVDNAIVKGNQIVPPLNPTTAPGSVNNNLKLWLKSNAGLGATTDGNPVSLWQDQAFDNHAVGIGATMPIYRNNTTRNINFNPVIDFVKSNRQVLKGKGGFWSQDYFLAVRVNGSFSSATNPGAYFLAGKFSTDAFGVDGTGVSMGRGSARYTNATISHTISSFPNGATSPPNLTSYGRTFQDNTQTPIDRVLILNIKSNTLVSPPVSEIYLNGKRIDNATGKAGNGQDLLHLDFNNLVYLLGTSYNTLNTTPGTGFNGFFDGRLAEIFTYSAPKSSAEQQKILSYLSLKYGTTLQSPGSSLAFNQGDRDLLDSQGNIIWNTVSAGGGFNYDIAGIGRDDASQLNQKQSKSQNNNANAPVLTMGLGDIATTNSANTNTFPTNRSYLVWGANGQNMNDSGVPIALNFGPATVSTLTSVSNRKWQVVETGGNVPAVKVSVPTAALTNFTPLVGNDAYVMVVADDAAFTTGIETIFLLTNGANQETLFDFDGTKYITFGVAHETVAPRHLTFDGNDDFVRMDYAPDLSSNFTVMAWIRNTGSNNPASDQAIIAKSNGTTGFTLYDRTNNRIRMEWTDSGLVNNVLTGTTQIPPNEWHHIAIIYTGGVARLYIDGVQDATANLNPPATTSHAFSIGAQFRSQSDIGNFFKGDIEEVRIWDTALTVDQIRFVMNQEILQVATGTRGVIIPNSITKNDLAGLNWNRLTAYYTMNSYIGTHINDDSQNNQRGRLIVPDKVAVMQQNAPLPYESAAAGSWSSNATWQNGTNMQVPYALSIVDGVTPVAWNIVRTNHNISSNSDKVVLGLMVNSNILTANNDTKLEVSHYLKLDGKIDLEGRSQLIQTLNSDLDPTSSGILERDQQGTVDIYKYNYWSSPVGTPNNTTNNNTHTLNSVLRDGTNSANPLYINWTTSLDGTPGPPVRISTRWTYKFENAGNSIANWVSIGSTGSVKAGQGYIHKGSGASSARQNYTFQGKPHNGQIQFNTPGDMLNLFGNPYASALDANVFLTANLSATDGALYFWEHWGGGTHRLLDYQGGYAVRNLLTGIPAMSHPDVSQTGNGTITPGRYIPVGQGFFVIASPTGGTITFNNDQRAFVKENDATSNIHFRANSRNDLNALGTQTQQFPENNQSVSSEEKITLLRLGYFTNNGFKRQVALGFVNNKATDGFDKGYDAWNIDEQPDDMYFVLDNQKLVIQGVGVFDDTKRFPIGLACQSHGKVKFVFDGAENLDENTPVFLFDKQTNTYYNLKENIAEIEIASAGIFNDRFVIQFTQNTLSTDDFENIEEQLSVFYLTSDHTLNILNTHADVEITSVQLYDLLGRLIESIALTNPSKSEIKIRLETHAQNIYVAKLTTTNGHSISKKILITY